MYTHLLLSKREYIVKEPQSLPSILAQIDKKCFDVTRFETERYPTFYFTCFVTEQFIYMYTCVYTRRSDILK